MIETSEALRIAQIRRSQWESLIERGVYSSAPATRQGKSREFTSFDMVALIVLGQLLVREVRPVVAAQIAGEVLRLVTRDRSITVLSAWKVWRAGKPQVAVSASRPNASAIELLRFDITAIRLEVNLAMREVLRSKSGST
jgi:hypothetical protein